MTGTAIKLRGFFGATWLERRRIRMAAIVGGGPILAIALALALTQKVFVWALLPLALPATVMFWLSLAVAIGCNNKLALHDGTARRRIALLIGVVFADLLLVVILFAVTAYLSGLLGQLIGGNMFIERSVSSRVTYNIAGGSLAWAGFGLIVFIGVLPVFLHFWYMIVVLFKGQVRRTV